MTQKTETQLYELFDNFQIDKREGSNRLPHSDIEMLVNQIMTIVDDKSSIEQVKDFMDTFNQKVRNKPEMPTPKECSFRLKLGIEEYEEAAEACGSEVLSEFGLLLYKRSEAIRYKVENARESLKPNLVGLVDALIDSQYILDGFFITAGMQDIKEEAFLEVHNSNMSKACNNEQEVLNTLDKYKEENVEVITLVKGDKTLILRKEDNKVLKSSAYHPAQLSKFIFDEVNESN